MAGDWGSSHNGVKIGCFYDGIELSSDGSKARITDPRVEISRSVNIVDSTNKLSVSGGAVTDDSWSNLNVGGSGSERIKTVSATWITLDYGATKTATFTASLSGVDYAGTTLSNSYTITYPARAYSVPATPSGMGVVRNSDTSFTLSWTNNATAGAPYTNVVLDRYVDGVWAAYTTLGAVTSYTDTTSANHQYSWRVRATNVTGTSGYLYAPATYGTTPTAPSGVSASWVSDNQINVSWTNNSSVVTNVWLYRWDNVGNTWNQIATLGNTTIAYQDLTTIADRRYCYAVVAVNLGIASGMAYSGYVATTPAAPINAVAAKSGTSVTTTWTNKATYSTAVEVWHAANGVWDGAALASLASTATSYTHSSVNTAQTHQYRVRAVNTRNSAYATTDTVQLLTAPLAPTVVASKLLFDAALEHVTISWTHNPVDSTLQTAAEIRFSLLGANTWTTLTNTTAASRDLDGSVMSNGNTYEVQVRTKGDYASFGAWSASQIVKASATPSVTINTPVSSVITLTAVLAIGWTFYDPESTAQASWVATLSKDGQELEELHGTTQTTATFKSALANDSTYVVGVKAQDGSGLWSAVATRTYTTDFVDPPTGSLEITFEPEYGRASIDIVTPAPAVGQADPVYAQVFRNGTLIADNLSPVSSTIDYVPPINTNVVYTVVVWSAIPTSAISEDYVVDTATPWVFINGGNGFAQVARLLGNPSVETSVQREKVLHQFAGRTKPVEFLGSSRSRSYKLSGDVEGINNGSELGEWTAFEDIADLPAPLVYRDPIGRRVFVSIGEVSISHNTNVVEHDGQKVNLASVSATLTEVDYAE